MCTERTVTKEPRPHLRPHLHPSTLPRSHCKTAKNHNENGDSWVYAVVNERATTFGRTGFVTWYYAYSCTVSLHGAGRAARVLPPIRPLILIQRGWPPLLPLPIITPIALITLAALVALVAPKQRCLGSGAC